MVFSAYLREYRLFQKVVLTKVIELIELHILCFITFYHRDDSFAEKDEQSLKIIAE